MKNYLISNLLMTLLLIGFISLSACKGPTDTIQIDGSVWFRERLALPPDAKLKVQLLDVSKMDVAAEVLAETVLDVQSVPRAFSLTVMADKYINGHSYAVAARITQGDSLLFINTQRYSVDLLKPSEIKLKLDKVAR